MVVFSLQIHSKYVYISGLKVVDAEIDLMSNWY